MTMGPIDVVINNELQRHVLHPGGVIGATRVYCDACRVAIHPEEIPEHLQRAITRALTENSR